MGGAAAGFLIGFWLYGIGRTMCETFSFDLRASLLGLLLGLIVPLAIAVPVLLLRNLLSERKILAASWPMMALGIALALGVLASEAWILHDESEFSAEVSKRGTGNPYARARAWPNGVCTLVYVPGSGMHATD